MTAAGQRIQENLELLAWLSGLQEILASAPRAAGRNGALHVRFDVALVERLGFEADRLMARCRMAVERDGGGD